MGNYHTGVILQNKSVKIYEIKVKEYKIIQKALFDIFDNFLLFINNLIPVLEAKTSLSRQEILQLDYISFCILLLHIRSVSVGDNIDAVTNNTNKIKIQINLSKLIEYLNKELNALNLSTLVIQNTQIKFKIPTLNDILQLSIIDDEIKDLFLFIDWEKTSKEQITEIVYNLPINVFIRINQQIKQINEKLLKIDLLKYLQNKDIKFPLFYTQTNLAYFIHLLFSTDLMSLYENIFALSKFANISSTYIESCTPGEFIVFVNLLKSLTANSSNTSNQDNQELIEPDQSDDNLMDNSS